MDVISVDCGRVRAVTMVKGTDRLMPVALAKPVDVAQVEYILQEADNITLVCTKHIDDTRHIFKLELREEREKEFPKVTIERVKEIDNLIPAYIFHITPDMTKFIAPGKYWYSISYEIRGYKLAFAANVLTILPNITDNSEGKIIQSEDLIDLDHYPF